MKIQLARLASVVLAIGVSAAALTGCCCYDNGCNPCCKPVSCHPPSCCRPNCNQCCCPQPEWCGYQPWDYCDPTAYRLEY